MTHLRHADKDAAFLAARTEQRRIALFNPSWCYRLDPLGVKHQVANDEMLIWAAAQGGQ
jgi:hypothetical protein